jgi:ribosome-binding protein aMBF1 (putative translation factor)
MRNNMEQAKKDKLMNCSTLDELLNVEYGEPGTESRKQFDDETQAFCLAQTLKEERLRAGLTQEQLAEKIGTKKTYIYLVLRMASQTFNSIHYSAYLKAWGAE